MKKEGEDINREEEEEEEEERKTSWQKPVKEGERRNEGREGLMKIMREEMKGEEKKE